jgi:hypothetical protein
MKKNNTKITTSGKKLIKSVADEAEAAYAFDINTRLPSYKIGCYKVNYDKVN